MEAKESEKVEPQRMEKEEIRQVLASCRQSTDPSVKDGGSIIHVIYDHIPRSSNYKPNERAEIEAERAKMLGLDRKHLTGNVERIWKSSKGDSILTMRVRLERATPSGNPVFRALNLDKGDVISVVKVTD